MPMIVLAECSLLPHALLPLYIFEPRYRQMLAYALEHDRVFCIGTLLGVDDEPEDAGECDEAIDCYSCAGLVRASVTHPDGTSRLILQGVQRVRFTEWIQREPFRIAAVERIKTQVADVAHAREQAQELIDLTRSKLVVGTPAEGHFDQQIGSLDDPEIVADAIGAHFLRRSCEKQALLAMERLEDRLDFLMMKMRHCPPVR